MEPKEGESLCNHKRDNAIYSITTCGIYQDFVKNILHFSDISVFSMSICLLALFCTFLYRYRQHKINSRFRQYLYTPRGACVFLWTVAMIELADWKRPFEGRRIAGQIEIVPACGQGRPDRLKLSLRRDRGRTKQSSLTGWTLCRSGKTKQRCQGSMTARLCFVRALSHVP